MNTRLQVEHPVTEITVGLDLVKEQIRIAAGERLGYRQEDIHPRGWALECRIYAEDPANNFFPSPGVITHLKVPSGPGVRVDSGSYDGWRVPLEYDPLLAKLVTWGDDRAAAIARMRRALIEYEVSGIQTNIPVFRSLMDHAGFLAAHLDTGFIDRFLAGGFPPEEERWPEAELAALLVAALESRRQAAAAVALASSASAWKMAGREELLTAWPYRRLGR
jgi:acetyl-CoA carboxylase biotin carboxylase subunit